MRSLTQISILKYHLISGAESGLGIGWENTSFFLFRNSSSCEADRRHAPIYIEMKYLSIRTARRAWTVAIPLLFIGGASIAGTYICSGLDGNEVYTDHNRPGCREFTPTPPNDIEGKPSAKAPQPPKKRSEPSSIPFSQRPSSERKSGAIADVNHNGASYSEQDLLHAVASGNKAKTELVLRGGISANIKDDQGQSALIMATALPSTDI